MQVKKLLVFYVYIQAGLILCGCSIFCPDKNNPCPEWLEEIGLTSEPPYWSPTWYPGGESIGFNHIPLIDIHYPWGEQCPGDYQFDHSSAGYWIINTNGTEMLRIFYGFLNTASWSPDGEWIAFVRLGQIAKMRFTGAGFDTMSLTMLTSEGTNYAPAWSPDREWIAYDSDAGSVSGASFIWKMRADGSDKTRIGYSGVGSAKSPSWSPSGDKITFAHYPGGSNNLPEIYTMNIDGTDWRRLTFNDLDNRIPKFSPDGTFIAFFSIGTKKPISTQIRIMRSDGSNLRLLVTGGVEVGRGAFSWSPASDEIVYTRYEHDDWSARNGVLWILNIYNGNKRQLTYNQFQ